MRYLPLLSAVGLLAFASAADAHPKLLNATVTPMRVELHFSERLMPQFSGADLLPAGGNTKLASTANVADDGRTLVVTSKGHLRPGRYAVAWRVVSVDTHRVAGTYAFAVKG